MLLGPQGLSEVMGVLGILDLLALLEPVESLLGSSGFLLLLEVPKVPRQLKEVQVFPHSALLLLPGIPGVLMLW